MKYLLTLIFTIMSSTIAYTKEIPRDLHGKTVTIVIPYAAGGNSDTWFRLLSKQVTHDTGLPIVVVNKPGASSNIGTAMVAGASPDGLTLLGTDSTSLVLNPLMNLPGSSDPSRFSIVLVNLVTSNGLYVAPDSKYTNLTDLIDDLKSNSNKLNYGCSTTVCEISIARMLNHFGINMPVVRYNSTPQVLTDIIGGTLTFAQVDPSGLNLARSGKVKPLAFSGNDKISDFSTVGLYKDLIPDFVIENFLGLYAPYGTPDHLMSYYNTIFRNAARDPKIQDIIAQRGSTIIDSDVRASNDRFQASLRLWKPMIDKFYQPPK